MNHPCTEGEYCLLGRDRGVAILARSVRERERDVPFAFHLIVVVRFCPWCGQELAKEESGGRNSFDADEEESGACRG